MVIGSAKVGLAISRHKFYSVDIMRFLYAMNSLTAMLAYPFYNDYRLEEMASKVGAKVVVLRLVLLILVLLIYKCV